MLALSAVCSLAAAGQGMRNRPSNVEMAYPRVARLPYTAEYKITRVRTLSNGSTVTRESTQTVALDAQGRRMSATTLVPLLEGQTAVTHINVLDPAAHTTSNWSVPGEKVTVMAMPVPGAARSACTTTSTTAVGRLPGTGVSQTRPALDELGIDTILGVEARGRRIFTTIPAGAIGNDAPIQRTTDLWTAIARGLAGLVVRQVSDDPQVGTTTKELVNFTQAEPDAAVFRPPADYEVVSKDAPAPACAGAGSGSTYGDEGTEPAFAPIPAPPAPSE